MVDEVRVHPPMRGFCDSEVVWCRVSDHLPPARHMVMVTGKSGVVNNHPHNAFLTLAQLDVGLLGKQWYDVNGTLLSDHYWYPTHWAECLDLPDAGRELERQVANAVARYNNMSPEQQAEARRQQQRSWVVGETMIAHPHMPREQAEAVYDRVMRGRQP